MKLVKFIQKSWLYGIGIKTLNAQKKFLLVVIRLYFSNVLYVDIHGRENHMQERT